MIRIEIRSAKYLSLFLSHFLLSSRATRGKTTRQPFAAFSHYFFMDTRYELRKASWSFLVHPLLHRLELKFGPVQGKIEETSYLAMEDHA